MFFILLKFYREKTEATHSECMGIMVIVTDEYGLCVYIVDLADKKVFTEYFQIPFLY